MCNSKKKKITQNLSVILTKKVKSKKKLRSTKKCEKKNNKIFYSAIRKKKKNKDLEQKMHLRNTSIFLFQLFFSYLTCKKKSEL